VTDNVDQNTVDQRERDKRQRGRSIAIALALGGFVLLFYAATIVRMGANVANRPLMVRPIISLGSIAP
jgi:hypothetical protein